MNKKVITLRGIEEDRISCRKFNKQWYKIGDVNVINSGDCYFIDGNYRRVETGQVVFDYSINQYILKSNDLQYGVIAFENNEMVLGYFSKKSNILLLTKEQLFRYVISEELMLNNKSYRERVSDGVYYHVSTLKSNQFNEKHFPDERYKHSLSYNSGPVMKNYVDNYNKLEFNNDLDFSNFDKILNGLSFGLEFETAIGTIPNRKLDTCGLIPLRDGSIPGIEYVTVPLEGVKGLNTLSEATKVLKKYTEFNDACSLHLHIGNIPRTKEFILAFFLLTLEFQDKFFDYFPIYKKHNFNVKRKNYSKPYDLNKFLREFDAKIDSSNIDKNFNVLYAYLSNYNEGFYDIGCNLDNVDNHPQDRNDNQKWNITNRYHFHNLIPIIFGNKSTIEFRIHTSTFDFDKILAFLMYQGMLVNTAIEYSHQILSSNNFLKNYNDPLRLCKKVAEVKNYDRNIINIIEEYFFVRKDIAYGDICSGNIVGDEERIYTPNLKQFYDKPAK